MSGESESFDPKVMIEASLRHARKGVELGLNPLPPIADLYRVTPDGIGVVRVVLPTPTSPAVKDAWAAIIEALIGQTGSFAYILITEAYVARGDQMSEAENLALAAALEHSELSELDVPKLDVVLAQYNGPGGPLCGWMEFGEDRQLGPVECPDTGGGFGRLVGLGGVNEERADDA